MLVCSEDTGKEHGNHYSVTEYTLRLQLGCVLAHFESIPEGMANTRLDRECSRLV